MRDSSDDLGFFAEKADELGRHGGGVALEDAAGRARGGRPIASSTTTAAPAPTEAGSMPRAAAFFTAIAFFLAAMMPGSVA